MQVKNYCLYLDGVKWYRFHIKYVYLMSLFNPVKFK